MIYRVEREVNSHIIVYEEYTRPPSTINRLSTTIISSALGKKSIRFRKYFRKGAALAIDKHYHSIDAACNIYITRYGEAALGIGRPEAIYNICRSLNIYTTLVPATITLPEAELYTVLRGRGAQALAIYFLKK